MTTSLAQLQLTNFRNYSHASFQFNPGIIALFGRNGIGKTNILEAITLLAKGRGLRGSSFDEMVNNSSLVPSFTIFGAINNHPQLSKIGTSYDKITKKRLFKIDERDNTECFPTFIWLTPSMDNIFLTEKSVRRKFLDKIVSDIDSSHSTRINNYDKLLRERINLLTKFSTQNNEWLNALERSIAELGSAIAIARNEAVEYLNQSILAANSEFIKTKISIIGVLERMALTSTAIKLEDYCVEQLRGARGLDGKIGRTSFGVHRSDLSATLLTKNVEARFCSTGEQKSILIALTFARIGIFSRLNLPAPILILDELASHLDAEKKQQLFAELSNYQVQSFLTATDQEVLSSGGVISDFIQFIEIK